VPTMNDKAIALTCKNHSNTSREHSYENYGQVPVLLGVEFPDVSVP